MVRGMTIAMNMPEVISPFRPFEVVGERLLSRLSGAARLAAAVPTPIERVTGARYEELEVEHDASLDAVWCWMKPKAAPSFTPGLLRDISSHQRSIRDAFAATPADAPAPVRHWVLASRLPGMFNLGGDLDLFAGWIRARDRDGLLGYARACIDVLHENAIGFDQSVITVALVQGDALGGGFEAALSCDLIVAERGAKFGLPEILFNLFPGMGAVSLLARRVGAAQAERIISSGKLYTAEELHALGLVHAIAEPGQGVAETHRLIQRNGRRHNGLTALFRAGRRVSPLLYSELNDIVEIWVDAALRVEDQDLRKMERLTAAQDKRLVAQSVLQGA